MKTKILLPLLLVFGALLVGCTTSAVLNNLHIGMDKSQVIALLGTPDSTSAQANVEYLTYYLDVSTNDGPVNRDRAYLVRLVDGKVESYGRFAQLNDLYLRPVTNALPGSSNFPQSNMLGLGATTTIAPAAPAAPDLASELEKLKALKDQGVLTDQEFQTAKAKLLGAP